MICIHLALYLYMALFVLPVSPQELTSTLHSTVYGLKFAYNGETVTFTCVTKGYSMAWSSDEYIGSDGNRLEFVSIEREGTTHRAGQAVATLVNVSDINGLIILKSVLHILVSSAFQISSIRCHSVGSDAVNTITFGTADNTSITCDKPAACPGETVTCTCITGYSNTLAWSSDEIIGPNDARLEFVSIEPVATRHNVTGSSTFAVLTSVSSPNGVVVLSSDLTFVASENPANILTCLNVGRQSSLSIIVPLSKSCVTEPTIPVFTTTTAPTTTTDSEFIRTASPGNTNSGTSNAAVTIIVVVLIIIILTSGSIIFILLLTLVHARKAISVYKNDTDKSDHNHFPAAKGITLRPLIMKGTDSKIQLSLKDEKVRDSGNHSDETASVERMDQVEDVATNTDSQIAELKEQEISNNEARNLTIIKDEQLKSGCTEELAKSSRSELPHESNIPKQMHQSTSGSGATALQHTQLSEEQSRGHENEIMTEIDMRTILVAVQSQKDIVQEIEDRDRKKKILDSLLNDVYRNTCNNLEDMNTVAGGSKERAQANKGSKEE